ncbi:hypothetical protein F5Y00DRAFT_258879 [Daldinia vernicosa]|uniref:uncharacterized protein n=1 Tax=Daldinia vernicosa TaxID=114800 RepID=UPI002007B52B|nr:uncharacterized protein F5Y00DRAFT_258879 [Daldinia vernicosa]KAI0851923.1 hypothetical protein F5Y00DRAFT_258879 [Daldinia vernicosa]
MTIGRQAARQVCIACRSKASGLKAPCNRPVEGHGCTACKQYGLPCIFGDNPLPPYPGPTRAPVLYSCDQCKELGLRCDFKRPCDRCHNAGTRCTGSRRYCFIREVPGGDMYGYYLNLGFGPNGINQVLQTRKFGWTMPADYHVQYMRWKNEGTVPREVLELQGEEPLQDQYGRIVELAQDAAKHGVPANLPAIMQILSRDVKAGVPLNESQAARDLMYYLGKQTAPNPRAHERQIEISEFNILYNEADLQRLNPGTQVEYSYIAPIRDAALGPVTRPASPGPARPNYWIPWNTKSDAMVIHDNTAEYPEGRPERVNMSAIRRDPFREHPNENAQCVLSSIPFLRMWDEGEMYPTAKPCEQEYMIDYMVGGKCGNPTKCGCEDTTHVGDGVPICDTCEEQNREKFYKELEITAPQMRQYLCYECSISIPHLLLLVNHMGFDVYYENPTGVQLPDFESHSLISTGLTKKVGGWKGAPLEITGCSCGVKLLGRRLCSPHRLQHLLDMQEAISNMKIYIDSMYGRSVCPVCKQRPGINEYNFEGPQGGEGVCKAWMCLVCHGFVLTENTTSVIPRFHLKPGAPKPAPAPYGIRPEELAIANDEIQKKREQEMMR